MSRERVVVPFDWQKQFVEPTARVIEKIRGRKMPEGVTVEKRRTAWERILHDDDTPWDKLKQLFDSKKDRDK